MKITRQISVAVLFFFSFSITSNAQLKGKVDYPSLGISVTIPAQWEGQNTEEGLLLTSYTIAGLAIVATHTHGNISALTSEFKMGLVDDAGTNLQLVGSLDNIDSQTIGGVYKGTLEWQPAKAYIVGRLNPNGIGISVVSLALEGEYAAVHKQTSKQIAKTAEFYLPKESSEAKEWKTAFANVRLSYLDSYYSGGTGYSSYSSRVIIDLCESGYFSFYSNDQMAIDTGDSSGANSNGTENDEGSWKIVSDAEGNSYLQLLFTSGKINEYLLEYEDSKTYLNGNKYYREYGEKGPDCR